MKLPVAEQSIFLPTPGQRSSNWWLVGLEVVLTNACMDVELYDSVVRIVLLCTVVVDETISFISVVEIALVLVCKYVEVL